MESTKEYEHNWPTKRFLTLNFDFQLVLGIFRVLTSKNQPTIELFVKHWTLKWNFQAGREAGREAGRSIVYSEANTNRLEDNDPFALKRGGRRSPMSVSSLMRVSPGENFIRFNCCSCLGCCGLYYTRLFQRGDKSLRFTSPAIGYTRNRITSENERIKRARNYYFHLKPRRATAAISSFRHLYRVRSYIETRTGRYKIHAAFCQYILPPLYARSARCIDRQFIIANIDFSHTK